MQFIFSGTQFDTIDIKYVPGNFNKHLKEKMIIRVIVNHIHRGKA